MSKYTIELEKAFQEYKEGDPGASKMAFIGDVIFDFTTYDGDVDEIFAKQMLIVLDAISNAATFKYQEASHDNYINYLTMVNMPFLRSKLDWGTSIRGAWFEALTKEELIGGILIKAGEFHLFVNELIAWAYPEECSKQADPNQGPVSSGLPCDFDINNPDKVIPAE